MILADLYDDTSDLPDQYTHVRIAVRTIAVNEHDQLGFLRIKGEDFFGKRNHLETIGGGVELFESFETAVHRELLEEIGRDGEIIAALGSVIDRYRLISRINVSHFYFVRLTHTGTIHRTPEEIALIDEVVWMTLEEALAYYEIPVTGVNHLVQRRDYYALLAYQQFIIKDKTEAVGD